MTKHLHDQICKRLTLNWLIQGASVHAGGTAHYLVRDQLNALDPQLLRLYDQFGLAVLLHHWHFSAILILGRPRRFWKRAASDPTHPFFGHPLLSRYGGILAETARRRASERCKEKGLTNIPVAFSIQVTKVLNKLRKLEQPHRPRLIQLAKEAASIIWGIPQDRLKGELHPGILPPEGLQSASFRGALLRCCVAGLGGVMRRGDTLIVEAKGMHWQLLTKEFVKGTAELICLHGLANLNEDDYWRVIAASDRLELEPWMLQSGGELWRRLLAVLPPDPPTAKMLMYLARSSPDALQSVIEAVITRPERARDQLAELAAESRAG